MSSNIQEAYMSFWEHLEALRWHIIRSLIAILGVSLLAFLSKQFVMHTLVLGPARPDFWTYQMLNKLSILLDAPSLSIGQHPLTLQSRQLTGQFTLHLAISLGIGFIGAFPYVIWELWCFINPAIRLPKRQIFYTICLVSLLFLLGLFFGYYIITPLVIQFLANYQIDSDITNFFDVTSYVSTLLTLTLACALVFQLPMAVYFLAKIGIVTTRLMRTYRRHAIVIILTLSAVITPPDMMSQVLLAIPLMLLYEFSIFIAQLAAHARQRPR
jgi:sec-independent protein translocase protein TatC